MTWKRPESVPFPSVWCRFDGKREINGNIPKFWIQDIPEDMFEVAADIMMKNFAYSEPLNKYSNLMDDSQSAEEIIVLWREIVQHRLGLICFMENPDSNGKPVIAGINMTYLSKKDEKVQEFKGKTWKKILNTIMYLCYVKDPFEQLGITEYMGAMGLSVLPEFRGQGIGEELLKARIPLCKAVGIKATLTVFTSIASQKLAEKVGFKDIVAMPYEELEKINPEFSYPGITEHTKSIRYMYKLV